MTTYLLTRGVQIAGKIIPPRSRLEHTDPRLEAIGKAEVKRLVAQGYFRVLGIAKNTEPGDPNIANPKPPLPTAVRTNQEGTRARQVEFGDPDKGGKVVNLELPTRIDPIDRDPATRPTPPKRKGKKPMEHGEPKGKWNLEPEAVADQDIDTLNALIHDIDPDFAPFPEGQEALAREQLTKDNRPAPEPENLVTVSDSLDAGKDDGRRATRRQPKTRRAPVVRKGA